MQDITLTDQLAEQRQQLEALQPSVASRILVFPNLVMADGRTRQNFQVVQEQLGMFPTQEFVTRIGEVIDDIRKGDLGIKLVELFSGEAKMPTSFNPETLDQTLNENMVFVDALMKLVRVLPDLQLDIMCLSLGIAPSQREWFKSAISRNPSQGGLTVDEGFDILIMFIRQNAKLIRRFFEEKAAEVVAELREQVMDKPVEGTATEMTGTPDSSSPGSMPSSTSSPATLASV